MFMSVISCTYTTAYIHTYIHTCMHAEIADVSAYRPLHAACQAGFLLVVEALLQAGCDVKAVTTQASYTGCAAQSYDFSSLVLAVFVVVTICVCACLLLVTVLISSVS